MNENPDVHFKRNSFPVIRFHIPLYQQQHGIILPTRGIRKLHIWIFLVCHGATTEHFEPFLRMLRKGHFTKSLHVLLTHAVWNITLKQGHMANAI